MIFKKKTKNRCFITIPRESRKYSFMHELIAIEKISQRIRKNNTEN